MKLKETQVTLLLSSRAEMQKVIEKARAMSSFANKAALPTPEAITNQFVTKKVPQQPALVSNYAQMQQQTSMMSSNYQPSLTNGIPGLGGGTNVSSSVPLYFNPVDYIKLVNSNAINQQIQQQQHLSRDPRGQSRYQRSDNREQMSRRDRSRSPYSSENEDKKEKRRRTRFSSPEKKNSMAPVIATNNSAVTAVVSSRNPQLALIQQQLMQQQHQQVHFYQFVILAKY